MESIKWCLDFFVQTFSLKLGTSEHATHNRICICSVPTDWSKLTPAKQAITKKNRYNTIIPLQAACQARVAFSSQAVRDPAGFLVYSYRDSKHLWAFSNNEYKHPTVVSLDYNFIS